MFAPDRGLRAFFRAMRRQPGFLARVASVTAFGLALALKSGIRSTLTLLVIVCVAAVALGYPLWRRRGRF